MKLLFRREQTAGRFGRVQFKLWAKVELDEQEKALVQRYRFDQAILIDAIQPNLIRNAVLIGLLGFVVGFALAGAFLPRALSGLVGIIVAGGGAYWWFNEKRETIFVRDLIHGRHFSCPSVIELAQKEAWLTTIVSFLRQVMESAKNWDGTETIPIEALPKAESKLVILRGL